MPARGEAGGFDVLFKDRVDNALMFLLDLLRQSRLCRLITARDLRGLDQEAEQKLDQGHEVGIVGGLGDTSVKLDIGLDTVLSFSLFKFNLP